MKLFRSPDPLVTSRSALSRKRLFVPSDARTWVFLIVALGLLLRLIPFLRVPSVWHDEAALLINVVRLQCHQMFGGLLEHVGAPPLFLIAERGMLHLFGDGIVSLRLIPFLAGCGSLIVVAHLAWRIVPKSAAPWAVALFAISDRLLWHSVEAKPYAVDVFVAALLIEFFLLTRHLPLLKQVLAAAPIMPVMVWFSYPSCFFVGAWFFVQFPALLRSRSGRDWLICVALAVAVIASFAALALGPIHAQRDDELNKCWVETFADWQKPWTVPPWIVVNTLGLFSYSIGPNGWMLAPTIVLGSLYLWRMGQRSLLAMLTLPIALACFAGMIGKYPYGDSRVCIYVAPIVCLLVGAGIPGTVEWLRRRTRWAVIAFWIVLSVPVGYSVFHIIVPWPRADNNAACDYVLANWQSGDAVSFNQWEGQYYFRHQASAWFDPAMPNTDLPKRVWCVAISQELSEREALVSSIAPGRSVVERRDFRWSVVPNTWRTDDTGYLLVERREYRFVTVALFERPSTTSGPAIP